MKNSNSVGNFMHLYLDEIQPGDVTNASNFLIKTAANTLNEKGGRNWIPIVVKEVGEDSYQVIGNSFIYAVARQAGLERVWCIIADDSDDTVALTKILAGEVIPKVNLSTASKEDIRAALEYLTNRPNNPIKITNVDVAVTKIYEAARQYWKNLEPITKLGCGINAAKIPALDEVFYLTPQEPPIETLEPEPPTPKQKAKTTTKAASKAKPKPEKSGVTSLDKMNIPQLKELAKERGITVTSKMKKANLLELLR